MKYSIRSCNRDLDGKAKQKFCFSDEAVKIIIEMIGHRPDARIELRLNSDLHPRPIALITQQRSSMPIGNLVHHAENSPLDPETEAELQEIIKDFMDKAYDSSEHYGEH